MHVKMILFIEYAPIKQTMRYFKSEIFFKIIQEVHW
jgi:hypothetical protein